ncbi:hypothetical protein KPL78_29800 [Roseomonas sp. HJA6]|uniref:Uncharacterized protein n=1 Tax=Roseomonas alba TaxID=2846776 RepID=A0ABS7AID7_9PROT|nr:hypothetical protein [Neoroseomonas alba]MBW6402078.1 hypothetical protein [Neoroseomonas alba]
MTTAVVIRSPSPNHQDVLVQKQAVNREGAFVDVGQAVRVTEGMAVTEYVHGGQRLVITEVTREG